jgi:DMSO reductase family type II enzyme heme b subunit
MVLSAAVGAGLWLAGPTDTAAQDLARGEALYDRWCAGCHGETGAGDGEAAAFMLPRPRDFTGAVYQIRTTASGELPTDADLRRVIDEGMPGTAMPGWRTTLAAAERDDVIAYLKSFSRFFDGQAPEPLEFGRPPGMSDEGLREGAEVYRTLECFKCHGDAGRGDGPSAPTMTDDWGFPIRPADLTRPWTFNGGPNVEDIYRRLRTGLDGTPMPSFSDAVEGDVVTDEQLWRLAQYVRSLSQSEPTVREVIRIARTDTVLPTRPDDPAWEPVEAFYVPMVGQIVVASRWFTPTVDGLWVQGLHDGTRLALRVSWSDPSRSPDAAWQEWLALIASTVASDSPIDTVQGADRLTVQFPTAPIDGLERPYFLGGDDHRPVSVWRWSSVGNALAVGQARGLTQFAVADSAPIAHAAMWADGRWRVVFDAPLSVGDSGVGRWFPLGQAIPVAFQAADGSSGEVGTRGSVSAWYALYLDVPAPASVLVLPVAAAIATLVLGAVVVTRAQRRAR